MKKLLNILLISILFVSCGRYKDLSPKEKFKVVYEAEVLQKKDARKTLNKIYKKINKYIEKKDQQALEDMYSYEQISRHFSNAKREYLLGRIPNSWSYSKTDEKDAKYPSVEEVMGDGVVSGEFRLKEGMSAFYDAIDEKVYNGKAIFRYGDGSIKRVILFRDGEMVAKIQENVYDADRNLIQEKFFSEETGKMICSKKFTKGGDLKSETYILKRFKNGKVKEDYVRENGEKIGRLRKYNTAGRIIKTQVK